MDEANLPKKFTEAIKRLPHHIKQWSETNPGLLAKGTAVSLAFVLDQPELAYSIFTSMIPDSLNLANTVKKSHHILELAELLEVKKEQINQSFIKSDYGHKLIKELISEIIDEVNEDKINYLKSFFVYITTSQNTQEQTIQMFHEKLIQMQPIHLQILYILHKPEDAIMDILSKSKDLKSLKLPADFNIYIKADPFIFDIVIDDLRTWNILKPSIGTTGIGNIFKDIDVTVSSVVRDTVHRFTGFGDEFIKFMKEGKITKNSIFIDYDKKITYYNSKFEHELKVRDIEKHGFTTEHTDHVNEKGEPTDGNSGRLTFK